MLCIRAFFVILAALLFSTGAFAAEWTAPDGRKFDIGSAPQFRNGDRVLWAGDSITRWHFCYFRYIEMFYLTRYPDRKITFFNGGISGSTAKSLNARFDVDVEFWKPTAIAVMLGMNDSSYGHFRTDNAKITPEYRDKTIEALRKDYVAEMTRLIDRMKALPSVRDITLITPTFWDEYSAKPVRGSQPNLTGKDNELKVYSKLTQELAREKKLAWVDAGTPMREYFLQSFAKNPAFNMLPDRCHPDENSNAMLARTFLAAQGVTPYNAVIRVENGKISGEECTISTTNVSAGKIEFTYLGSALPLVIEDRYKELLPMLAGFPGDFRGSVTVKAEKLAPGNYILSANGKQIGKATEKELAAGVNLAAFPNFPDSRQSAEVVALNARRISRLLDTARPYVDAVGRIRAAREIALRQNKPLPDDDHEALKEMLRRGPVRDEESLKRLFTFGTPEAIAAWSKEFSDLTDQLYVLNQPKPCRIGIVWESK